MARRECCVKSCGRSSHDFRGRKLLNGLTFHCFPAWRTNEGAHISELTKRRRSAWVAAVARSDLSFSYIPSYMRVCSRHFHSGKPAYEKLDLDPDWVPSLHLGHDEGESARAERLLESNWKKRKRLSTERRPTEVSGAPPARLQAGEAADCVVGRRNAADPSWREVQSKLRSLLKAKSKFSQKTGEEKRDGPAAKTADVSFREFFRSALEASLEASIRSRAQSKSQSSSQYNVQLDLEPLEGEPVTCEESCSSSSSSLSSSSSSSSSSISCQNCVRLQRRIQELEEKLFALAVEQDYATTSEAPYKPDKTLQDLEEEDEEEVQYELTEHHSPGEVVLDDEVQYEDEEDLDSESSSSSPTRSPTRFERSASSSPNETYFIPRQRTLRTLRFKKEWLSMFPFLRYSPSLNLMWCHVCRVHADNFHRNLALITGSRHFKKDSIVKHSNTNYHQNNLKRYMLNSCAS